MGAVALSPGLHRTLGEGRVARLKKMAQALDVKVLEGRPAPFLYAVFDIFSREQ